jgi:hypothetical protein
MYSCSNYLALTSVRFMDCTHKVFPPFVIVARVDERKGTYGVLIGKPERKSLLGRSSRRWEDNTKMDIQEI